MLLPPALLVMCSPCCRCCSSYSREDPSGLLAVVSTSWLCCAVCKCVLCCLLIRCWLCCAVCKCVLCRPLIRCWLCCMVPRRWLLPGVVKGVPCCCMLASGWLC